VLELQDVRKQYAGAGDESVHAVDGVTLAVDAGELVALYGPSGSGKSTLLSLAAAIVAPDAGSVRFDGRDLASLSRREAARYRLEDVGFVFQTFRLVPGLSAIDNAALKLMGSGLTRRDARDRVLPLLELLGIDRRAEQRSDRLSVGERQRVALARALSNEPRLILADEPTGSLDSRRGREVFALLADVCHERGIATLLVTHDPTGAGYADRVHTLTDGRLVAAVASDPTATRRAGDGQLDRAATGEASSRAAS
jgi:putative ABC transport system ATP-binding protein